MEEVILLIGKGVLALIGLFIVYVLFDGLRIILIKVSPIIFYLLSTWGFVMLVNGIANEDGITTLIGLVLMIGCGALAHYLVTKIY